ncbi:hypothetical protein MJO28_009073 [Puccinia striiformis f. sp. tritici]|uniref:Uncharacterized protein n=1 Tax=Puccinia striiformis f. sp. tritici TaxID=168172 RepID=A0ACC0E862_9BASI|nr:hypothetical protein MJO28_009073 [Puccinia striiformis f. sp. tritici]KAI9616060.1 hypothetical protein H4Q26_011312 [Puccinia striiformis f. sp. tritici PST-130]
MIKLLQAKENEHGPLPQENALPDDDRELCLSQDPGGGCPVSIGPSGSIGPPLCGNFQFMVYTLDSANSFHGKAKP